MINLLNFSVMQFCYTSLMYLCWVNLILLKLIQLIYHGWAQLNLIVSAQLVCNILDKLI